MYTLELGTFDSVRALDAVYLTNAWISGIGQDLGRGKRPTVTNSTYLGTSADQPASQYVSHAPAKPEQLAADMLDANININLIHIT